LESVSETIEHWLVHPRPKFLNDNADLHYNYVGGNMAVLTVTARGQVTFRKDVLQHLGIEPGEKIELQKMPDGQITLRAARPSGKIDRFFGLLAGKSKKVATLDEIQDAAAAGWARRK
jgi:AbrB family looped-hinge helix DNA binding protein